MAEGSSGENGMRYVIYGDDALSRQPCEPVVVDAASEGEARGRAVARGMAVRAVIAAPAPESAPRGAELGPPIEPASAASDELRGVQLMLRYVVLPLVIAFFLMLAVVRTFLEAAAWTVVWSMGLILGAGLAGLVRWLSHGIVPVETAWPVGLLVGLAGLSALHGWQVGWRWWWAKRSLAPLAQVLGVAPDEAGDDERTCVRLPVVLSQALAGTIVGTALALAGWLSHWGVATALAGIAGGALGLGTEGAILGAVLARRRPILVPGAANGPSFESLAGLLARIWGNEHIARSWVLGFALDRATPGAVAGALVGLAAFLLGWWATL
jgi:hypothetical protein